MVKKIRGVVLSCVMGMALVAGGGSAYGQEGTQVSKSMLDASSMVKWFSKTYGDANYAMVFTGDPFNVNTNGLKGRVVTKDELAGLFELVLIKNKVYAEPNTHIPDLTNARPWLWYSVQQLVDAGVYQASDSGLYTPAVKASYADFLLWSQGVSRLIAK